MHEARLCLSLLELVEQERAKAGARRVRAVRLEVGAWSGVVPEALARAFPLCAAGTAAEGAALRIDPVAGRDLVLRELEVE